MMIKKLFLLLFISVLSFVKAQDDVPDLLSIPGPIEYDGSEYFLSWSKPISKTLYRQQYLPRDEQIEDFTQLLDFSYFTKEIEIELAVRQKVEGIQQRSKSDKFAKVNVIESPDGTEYIVDYFISESPEKGDSFLEYNVYRFKSLTNGTDKSFLILSHAKRMYGDLKSSAKSMARQRDHLLTTMIEFKIPEITATAKN
ncbi:hypothetical protein Q73A0000_00985 [Kaistella flava (ex Peng et al. 2021)]|uniref:DUF4468 domain-containing protein n=1 Tax=Kaistella flava (ex Peng et al. 2021) TaxID=2038776 RepID=A0A7M2Y6N5_9FLAO|nr:hypothetical protein [Kaistella flava (ex Peng et al. 2021)]QOW09023.1 hypothetical protein Q73A0000_00985 [Kaistella flava (ex Peng et al. 2021)]